MKQTILLIDGSSFIFRAFYAVKNLTAPNGTPTNAIYGVINMLKQMQKKYTTPYWVCVFDAKGKTFRDDIYPEYKATRRETPEELKIQIPMIQEIVADLGIPVIVENGVEADDVIATIAKKYSSLGYDILVATGDKDFAQIVDENITLVNTMTNEVLDEAGVLQKFGVQTTQIIDYLSLIGDTVDNVPGVTKCGPKTAVKWLEEYGSISNLIENKNKLMGVVGENFRNAIEWLPTAQRLITIDCNVNITEKNIHNIESLTVSEANYSKLVNIFRELNFRTWLRDAETWLQQNNSNQNDLFNNQTESIDVKLTNLNIDKPLEYIHDNNTLQKIVRNIIDNQEVTAAHLICNDYTNRNSPIVAMILESDSTRYIINIMTISNPNDDLLIMDNESTNTNELQLEYIQEYWQSSIGKIVANSKDTYYQLETLNIQPNNIIGDLALASYIAKSTDKHNLSEIITRELQIDIANEESIFGKGAKRQLFNQIATDLQTKYLDGIGHILDAHRCILTKLDEPTLNLYQNIELPLAKILYSLEKAGIKIDIVKLRTLSNKLHIQLKDIENKVHATASQVFNLNSPKQLQDILFTQLKLPTDGIKKITSGFSTDEESLNILSEQGFSIADLLLEYRYLNKLLNTYVDKLPEYADNKSLVHTSLEQTIVTSGRLSSKDPNLQNIPVRSEYGQLIRECFIATENHSMICADYSQIELRILAHISQDENLISAFNSGADIHLATASQIFAKPINEITKDERRYAKSINFGLIYGKSVFGLAKELKIDRAAAKIYIDNYFAQYPKVKQFMENIKKSAHSNGYVETIYGRKIFLPNINSSNKILSQADERLALNAPMQGSASDIIKIAMININKWINNNKLQTKMILQVHDELIFDVPQNEIEIILTNLPKLMSEQTPLSVALEIEAKSANNWGEAH